MQKYEINMMRVKRQQKYDGYWITDDDALKIFD